MNNKTRIFIGIQTSEKIKNKILETQNLLNSSKNEIKWVKKNNLHLTLKFLGYITDEQINIIDKNLEDITKKIYKFNLEFTKVGAFPKNKYPKIIWIGTQENSNEINNLYLEIEKRIENNPSFKKNKFYPHITIGRVKKIQDRNKLSELITNIEFKSETMEINSIKLYKSNLTSKGSIYTILKEFKLKK